MKPWADATPPWLRVVLAAVLLAGCARTTEGVGGETNWLKCKSDAQCGDGFACHEGECVPDGDAATPDGATATSTGTPSAGHAGAGAAPDAGTGSVVEPPGPGPSQQAASGLGLAQCAGEPGAEWLVDFTQPQACATGVCPMQGMGIAAIDGDRALILADDESGSVTPGIPGVAVLDTGTLAPFTAIPSVAESALAVAAGTYVAVIGQSPSPFASLYAWRDGALASMGGHDEIRDIAADDSEVIVAGNLMGPTSRSAWLARVDESGAERWHVGTPTDAAPAVDELSIAVARDPSDGSLSWLLGRNDDTDWVSWVVRVDEGGDHLWATPLADESAEWHTDLDNWLLNPGVAAGAGVTSIAGGVNTQVNPGQPQLRLSFRQLDDAGNELRRWDGLDTDSVPNATPIVADDEGNVYVAWLVRPLASPQRSTVILRFAPSGDPCVLTEVPDQFPVDLELGSGAVWFVTTESVGRVAP